MAEQNSEIITPETAVTLAGLFRERIVRSADETAYHHYDIAANAWQQTTWRAMALEVGRWQKALLKEGLKPGEHVGIMLRNSREWVVFDQAAHGLGLVVVPLYTDDRPENAAYILEHAQVKLLLVEGKRQWQRLQRVSGKLEGLQRIVSVNSIEEEDGPEETRLESLSDWIFGLQGELVTHAGNPHDLATIVYTSGTTGRPKGVMLSHHNILSNAWAAAHCGTFGSREVFVSFLPLSHMLERTAGYYFPMMLGAEVAFSRSVQQLAEDLKIHRPTMLISVPRIYERVYLKIMAGLNKQPQWKQSLFKAAIKLGWARFQYAQGRASWRLAFMLWPVLDQLVAKKVRHGLGGQLRYAICGGAAMPPEIAKTFIALGLPIVQGYGLTEASPVIAVNRPEDNVPESIGVAVPGVEVKIGAQDELLARGPNIMLGYWQNEAATAAVVDSDGWLHSGDQARMEADGHLYITGRLKEIIVLANGEKIPPADMEMAIAMDPLFEQVMVIGEAKPFLSALLVLSRSGWEALAEELGVDPFDEESLRQRFVEKAVLSRVAAQLVHFPGYAQIRRALLTLEPWTIDDGLLTPTLKMKRPQILKRFAPQIDALYTV